MSKRLLRLVLLISFLGFLFYWTGCKNTIDENPTASLELESTGSLQLSFSKTSVTTSDSTNTVDTVTAILTRSGYESISKSLAIVEETASAVIYNVAEGTWQLTVKAKDSTGTVLYSGVAEVEIEADTTTYVTLELSAASTSGNLSITVTWEQGDGINWTEYSGNPVLTTGESGEWDDNLIYRSTVLYSEGEYEMWYAGNDGSNWRIGYAYSSDGINWTKYSGNPVLDLGETDSWSGSCVRAPSVIYDGSSYKMWFTSSGNGSTSQIGYATSTDGVNWHKYSEPVLKSSDSEEWADSSVSVSTVIFDGSSYEMWYSGFDGSSWMIGYATSADGINWARYSGNPVVDLGESGAWDDEQISYLSVILTGNDYQMWYSGYDGTNWSLGYATSSDGKNWTKYSGNPILSNGETGSWNEQHILLPSVLYDGRSYKIWALGIGSGIRSIGYATSP